MGSSSPVEQFPTPLKYLHTLLTATEDTHEARTSILCTYDNILVAAMSHKADGDESRELALSMWNKRPRERVSTPSGFFNQIWQELMERRDELFNYIYLSEENRRGEKVFMGLRVDQHSYFLLQSLQLGYDGQFTDLVFRLVAEQPQYYDRPSGVDEIPTDLLVPTNGIGDGESRATDTVVLFLVHHVAYVCDLFKKTDYAPSAQVVEALAEYRVNQLSRMFADPMSHIPLHARIRCSRTNHRTIQDAVVQRARTLLESTEREYLNWEMYKWLLCCVEGGFPDNPSEAIELFRHLELGEITDPAASPQPDYVPGQNTGLVIPDHIIEDWQDYDPDELNDVEFEATGPRILVKNVARPVQPRTDATCTVCLESFAVRRSSTVAWKVGCGHMFHKHCLRSMINGVEKNSNCCPLCRAQICEARERQRIIYAEDDEEWEGDSLGTDVDD